MARKMDVTKKLFSKPKILFIYSNMGDGGTQRQRSILSKELQKEYDLSIALFENIQLHKFYGKIIDLKAPTSKNIIILIKNTIKRIILIKKLTKNNSYDLVVSSSFIANFICLLTWHLGKIKIPLLITFNNSLAKTKKMGVSGKISMFIIKKYIFSVTKIITVSKGLEKELIKANFPAEKIITIYNGIDFKEMKKKSEEKIDPLYEDFFSDSFYKIISIGRLNLQKDFKTLIKAFAIVIKTLSAKLYILGEGEELNYLQSVTAQVGLENNIYFLGWVDNPYKYLKKSDLFVLSSLWEGFPNVLIEALGCDLPIVSTDCPTGPSEIITPQQNGLLVPIKNEIKMAEAIINILKDKSLYTSLKKKIAITSLSFDIKNVALQWDQLFKEILVPGIGNIGKK